ncbi:MAG: crossover junction endodeoxyribonuclease RuvC [Elusimicrobiaceae bacterium]|uniref:Crossover junction endodeoxyribonuclease RuvC n=1 Tax=Candidatus Avelusimicrobium gallicola TaxID=2562704 RepID=A0A928DPP7_9BACT|nr:crossover junction endodeoxyribonuclease RuvC [Elusimicrobium sp.]MBQ9970898.1 crossover junction endodeoxyribonuclease RuvC [Elusimicrobiaceae bacterium]
MTETNTTVLGIDPGLDRTGWAILTRSARSVLSLRACGLIHTGAEQPLPKRLDYIFAELQKILSTYQPDQVAMEQNYFLKRAQTMANTVMTRGVILLACEQAGKEVTFYPPTRVKMMICGTGTADKKQVQRMVQLTLNLDKAPSPDDTADAVAIGICHLKTAPLNNKLNVKAAFLAKLKAAHEKQIKKK